jgi:hypothetical protein
MSGAELLSGGVEVDDIVRMLASIPRERDASASGFGIIAP